MSQTLNAPVNQSGKPASSEAYHAMEAADVIGKRGTNLETGLSSSGNTAWILLWRQINSVDLDSDRFRLRRDAGGPD